ncbi:MAG TPA: hypothetical protein VLF79_01845 [Candidatus Saccharimonadales bacterium]|nr:hypothetical protein [Candidatus Saccharimonadales bacterium]
MPRHWENPGYEEERVDEGADVVFGILGGKYIDHKTSRFIDHERRTLFARHALRSLDMPIGEIEDAIALGEGLVREHVKLLQDFALREQVELREILGA